MKLIDAQPLAEQAYQAGRNILVLDLGTSFLGMRNEELAEAIEVIERTGWEFIGGVTDMANGNGQARGVFRRRDDFRSLR